MAEENNLVNLTNEPAVEFPPRQPVESEKPASLKEFKFNWQLPKFSNSQLEKSSDIISDIGLVVFASVALPAILGNIKFLPGTLGTLMALSFWLLSLRIRKHLP